MSNRSRMAGLAAAAAVLVAPVSGAVGAEVKLPKALAWSAYNVGTTGYNQSVAIGKALKDAFGVSLRVIPGKNDISRLTPLKSGKVQFAANGAGTYFSFEGVFDFAAPQWGPQDVRMTISALSDSNLAVGVAKDTNIKTIADLKGKRVVWVRGAPALNIGVQAYLAFGGLTWNDVTKVEVPGYGASWRAILNNQADAGFASTVSGPVKRMESSPRGIYWPPLPKSDKAGWARLQKVAPYIVPHMATIGTGGISKSSPHEGGSYPYPILITYAGQDAEMVYSMTRAIDQQFSSFVKAMPALKGWGRDRQTLKWAVPYHEGAVRYWKEAGMWTADMQAHNDRLVARQKVLKTAWKKMAGKSGDGFRAEWMKIRAAALDAAGFNPVWR
jgi:TRAP transporter TAXI family solute receptor